MGLHSVRQTSGVVDIGRVFFWLKVPESHVSEHRSELDEQS